MLQRAQVSIEFLLVFSVLISILFLFFPIVSEFREKSSDWFELKKATFFADQIKHTAQELSFLSSGSALEVSAHPGTMWKITIGGNKLFFEISQKQLERNLPIMSLQNTFICKPGSCRFSIVRLDHSIQLIQLEA